MVPITATSQITTAISTLPAPSMSHNSSHLCIIAKSSNRQAFRLFPGSATGLLGDLEMAIQGLVSI